MRHWKLIGVNVVLCDLSGLKPGICACVQAVDSCDIRERLMDMGFTKGAVIRCLYAAPGETLKCYMVRGAMIALRREDAKNVRITRCDHAKEGD